MHRLEAVMLAGLQREREREADSIFITSYIQANVAGLTDNEIMEKSKFGLRVGTLASSSLAGLSAGS